MRIMNLEDNTMKHVAVSRVVKTSGTHDLHWARDLRSGMEQIKAASEAGTGFDLIITDMNFPLTAGDRDAADAGEQLMASLKEAGLPIPVIVCSSVNLLLPEAYGCVWYSEIQDWENDLLRLLNRRAAELH